MTLKFPAKQRSQCEIKTPYRINNSSKQVINGVQTDPNYKPTHRTPIGCGEVIIAISIQLINCYLRIPITESEMSAYLISAYAKSFICVFRCSFSFVAFKRKNVFVSLSCVASNFLFGTVQKLGQLPTLLCDSGKLEASSIDSLWSHSSTTHLSVLINIPFSGQSIISSAVSLNFS